MGPRDTARTNESATVHAPEAATRPPGADGRLRPHQNPAASVAAGFWADCFGIVAGTCLVSTFRRAVREPGDLSEPGSRIRANRSQRGYSARKQPKGCVSWVLLPLIDRGAGNAPLSVLMWSYE